MKAIQMIDLTPEQLIGLMIDGLKTQFGDFKKSFTTTEDDLLTREETAELLKINLSTLHNWTKEKKLTSYGIGGRVYYKRNEIVQSLLKLN